jgi:hypothetical protein
MVDRSIPLRSPTIRELLPSVRNSGQIGEKGADQPERERLKNVELWNAVSGLRALSSQVKLPAGLGGKVS